MQRFEHVIFDFDGTCTNSPAIQGDFSVLYWKEFADEVSRLPTGIRGDLSEVTREE
jgi:beta-phosphoglucomutase-like phosphatase (HAD superfamily)